MEPARINIDQKFLLFDELWTPKIIAGLNGQFVKIAKIKGEYIWHHHQEEDEMFMVIKGILKIRLPSREVILRPGEMIVVPKGLEHCPVAEEECQILMIEPETTLNTGNIINEHTLQNPERI